MILLGVQQLISRLIHRYGQFRCNIDTLVNVVKIGDTLSWHEAAGSEPVTCEVNDPSPLKIGLGASSPQEAVASIPGENASVVSLETGENTVGSRRPLFEACKATRCPPNFKINPWDRDLDWTDICGGSVAVIHNSKPFVFVFCINALNYACGRRYAVS